MIRVTTLDTGTGGPEALRRHLGGGLDPAGPEREGNEQIANGPAGAIVESFTDPERDPLQAELFEDPPRIANGMLTLKEQPGLGLTLSGKALKKFGERIL